ncbi:MAG: hypothetical protein IJT62_01245 [Oscillospiraceae bacterium]|nr:hypothetical protein [Oscillospiraceae bacterium]
MKTAIQISFLGKCGPGICNRSDRRGRGLPADTVFHSADGLLCSDGGAIRSLTASEKEQAEALLIRYFTARLEPPEGA